MDIVVVGKHGEVDGDLRATTVEKVERVNKFANDVRRIEVDYAHHPTRRAEDSHTCEILVHVRQHLVKGSSAAVEFGAALDLTLDKVEQQMRRLHERRIGRRNGARARGARATNGGGADAGVEPGELAEATGGVPPAAPTVVKTKQVSVKPMDVDEAALQMEMLGHDFFVFTRVDSGRSAVLYRRRDGQLGLIETTA